MPVVDLSFPLRGDRIPLDHGYRLYSALSRVVPTLHGAAWLGVHPISGKPVGDGQMTLAPTSDLRLRLPSERIGDALPLTGVTLDLQGIPIAVGVPRVRALEPAAALDARLVVIKLTGVPRKRSETAGREALDADAMAVRFAAELTRQLAAIGVARPFDLCGRRSITVDGKRVVGYSVRVRELLADESLRVQEAGVGGKRRMGCGVFRPTRGRVFGAPS